MRSKPPSKPPGKPPPEPAPPPPPASREEAFEFLRWMSEERRKRKKPWKSFEDPDFVAAAQKRFKVDLRAIARRLFSDLLRGPRPQPPLGKPRPGSRKPRAQKRRSPAKKK